MPRNNTPDARSRLRDARCLDLKASGLTWDQVAREVGYATPQTALRAAQRCLKRVEVESAGELRRIEGAHLDGVRRRLMLAYAHATDAEVPKIAAQLIALSARISRLNGLDAPVQVEVEHGVSAEEFAVTVEALLERAGRDVPPHIAVQAADARRQGIVIDAEVMPDEPNQRTIAAATPEPVPDSAADVVDDDLPVVIPGPAWTDDDGAISVPFAVADPDDEQDFADDDDDPVVVGEHGDGAGNVPSHLLGSVGGSADRPVNQSGTVATTTRRPVASAAEPDDGVVNIEGWNLRPDHPLRQRPSFGSAIDRRRIG